ncbi:hypothetical protein A3D62_03295 [Candidatus Kaiserbacteria bacterium RIFCSPHIGHO2_02_FULL_49_11]|uniref:Extracellular solute-binding protein n=1 Tax=Candidatus Kaiserbacteria bacterium RIFCSPHIGHO2_02_FULL_49_11 TaxID=1798489 RepID=A0A1F6CZT0_9BACT|nr:MAG: hypothetical protein A3D62_03295 [Candidatus Kaiserbacteria bacterium RIFCSPHIGHO2_02_FULL_49_11]
MSGFQIAVTGVFIFFTVGGVLLFAGVGGFGGDDSAVGAVEIWGTYNEETVREAIKQLSYDESRLDEVTYRQIDPRFFDDTLVEGLASGKGPDLFFLHQAAIVRYADKVLPISYKTMSAREFRNTFIEEGELYLGDEGVLGLPLVVDPMIMYWNRTLYGNRGVSRPPQYWDEFLTLAEHGSLTSRNQDGTLSTSALALGEYRNIAHAKELLSLIMMQAGASIVGWEEGTLVPQLVTALSNEQSPADNALRFYTDFANPAKTVYSWNRSLPEAQAAFVGGTLATYFGFASEINLIRQQNPNLNFDVALMPQVRESALRASFGNMAALALSRGSVNQNGALTIALILTSREASARFSEVLNLSPVRRDLLQTRPADPFRAIFADAALQSKGWLDPSAKDTEVIFQNMIESVASGRARVSEAVNTADSELRNALIR